MQDPSTWFRYGLLLSVFMSKVRERTKLGSSALLEMCSRLVDVRIGGTYTVPGSEVSGSKRSLTEYQVHVGGEDWPWVFCSLSKSEKTELYGLFSIIGNHEPPRFGRVCEGGQRATGGP